MSLITDALQKSHSHSPADRPSGSSPLPPWWSAAVVLGAFALLWWWAGHAAGGRTPPHRAPAAAASTPKPLTPILSLLPAVPVSPAMGWRVDGVVTGMGTPLAIINGKTLAEGEHLPGGTRVVSVSQEQIELEHEGATVTLAVEGR